jgi:hypothetical protein
MTVEEFLEKNYFGMTLDIAHSDVMENDVKTAMQEYAQMKCKQLLKIVVKEARINFSNDKSNDFGIDKDSILNCVDLEKFCK